MICLGEGLIMPLDANVQGETQQDAAVWDLPALRRHFGHSYEFSHIGLTWYAWPQDGHLTRAITAMTGEELRTKIINDLGSPRARIPHQRPS